MHDPSEEIDYVTAGLVVVAIGWTGWLGWYWLTTIFNV